VREKCQTLLSFRNSRIFIFDLLLWPQIAPSVFKLETLKFGSRQPHPLQKVHHLDCSYFVWELRNEGFTKKTNQMALAQWCYFWPPSLTSNISGPRQNIKNWSVDFVPLIWGLFLPIFSFLASKLWKDIEVTDRHFIPTQALLKNLNSPLTTLASLGRDRLL